ncbi:hypothetical protein E2C01_060747 [Portunus trituberculatus]|uniref:Uncharacterized protein n=1 Tax=Portunus trituberculatus TaxID=210409 RepID=A0A5B7H9J3_PORTR|nr:hypothetical protein [Portunus trituberculatus]
MTESLSFLCQSLQTDTAKQHRVSPIPRHQTHGTPSSNHPMTSCKLFVSLTTAMQGFRIEFHLQTHPIQRLRRRLLLCRSSIATPFTLPLIHSCSCAADTEVMAGRLTEERIFLFFLWRKASTHPSPAGQPPVLVRALSALWTGHGKSVKSPAE